MDMSKDERQAAWAALRMVRDAAGELFGPVASIESEEAVLHRGPEYQHEAEAIIAALQRVAEHEQVLAAHVEQLRGHLVGYSQLLREKATTFAGYSEADIAHRSAYYREAHAVDAAYKAASTTSLTRLKTQWQGEILDELGAWIIQRDECIDELDIEEFRLERSEAEEGAS